MLKNFIMSVGIPYNAYPSIYVSEYLFLTADELRFKDFERSAKLLKNLDIKVERRWTFYEVVKEGEGRCR